MKKFINIRLRSQFPPVVAFCTRRKYSIYVYSLVCLLALEGANVL